MATVRLKCNACGTVRQAQPGVPIADLRKALVETAGWSCAPERDVDLCSRCKVTTRAGAAT